MRSCETVSNCRGGPVAGSGNAGHGGTIRSKKLEVVAVVVVVVVVVVQTCLLSGVDIQLKRPNAGAVFGLTRLSVTFDGKDGKDGHLP